MTQRDRQTSGGVFEVGARPAAVPAAPGPPTARGPLWEDLYRSASPAQQRELLALAGRQGVLYAHQLPAPNGTGDRNRQLLGRLLNGQTRDLQAIRPAPVEVSDTTLDATQREAVARALHTPDVCLIQGLPGTGKSRVVAEILTQAAARGERVLLQAPTAAAIDRVLEALAEREAVCPIRCLDRDERLEALAPAVRGMTLAERARRLMDHALPLARQEAAAAAQRGESHRTDESVWERLRELAESHRHLADQAEALRLAREAAAAALEREVATPAGADTPFAAALQTLHQTRDEARKEIEQRLAEVKAQIDALRQEEAGLTAKFEALRPLADAKEHKRWWTGTWWRATIQGDVLTKAAELQTQQQKVHADLEVLEQQLARLGEQQQAEEQRFEAERAALVEKEAARRRVALDEQDTVVQHDLQLLREKARAACQELHADAARPADLSPAAVAEARAAWQARVRQEAERAVFARQWEAVLEEAAETFPARLLELCNVVAATTTALPADLHFGETAPHPVQFDLLVVEEADQVTESEFVNVARRARRWVLIGQPAEGDTETRRHGDAETKTPSPRRRVAASPRRQTPAALRPGFFQRLWHHLHCDPRRLPYVWVQEKDGLCCRLRPVTPEQSQYLESERVADMPDVELRILALPRCEPLLAEMVFPPAMSIEQAKAYVFKEVGELPVRALGHSLTWAEDAERVVLRLAGAPTAAAVPVALAAGVREMVAPVAAAGGTRTGRDSGAGAWETCCVEFDRSAGWHRDGAEEWVRQHLGLTDLGRTVRFDVPYRMHPDLTVFLSDLLFAGDYRLAACAAPELAQALQGCPAPVEFVPVPPLHEAAGERERAGVAAVGVRAPTSTLPRPFAGLSRKGGAGLELDLADSRHRDRLPPELRPDLPERGLVNYLEAQAVLRTLEALVADPAVQALAGRRGEHSAHTVGVMALYPAQVELIRRLMQQSPTLAATEVDVKVDVPAAFGEQECWVVLLSLTRSHTHRAVSFGDGPRSVALALTRARARLVLFGDPGTLVRRSQWDSALDHLDEAASARERELVAQLVHYLQGHGPHPQTFHLREGGGA